MKIYGVQFDIAWEDKTANFAKVRGMLDAARPQRGSLVCLPEMFATGFSMDVEAIAEDRIDGPTLHFLSQCAEDFGVFVVGGFVSRAPDGKGRNELAVYGPDGKRVCDYTKIHPFSYGEESKHYGGGDRVCRFEWNSASVAPFICYDLRFPEMFRVAVRDGAEILVLIANWPAARETHWLTLLRARAIENQAYVVGVNRCGKDPKVEYSGHSTIIDPRGSILVETRSEETVFSADIDVAAVRDWRAQFPALKDMRDDFLGSK